MFEHDLRTSVIGEIQAALDREALGHYTPRPGGRSSIDVTLEKLDKAYALEFLIDHLHLQGHAKLGEKFGSNAVYFGDEVIVGGGNDYPVTRIPGLLIFAVNRDRQRIPFHSHVFVPSSILSGPEATAEVLTEFNRIANELVKGRPGHPGSRAKVSQWRSALDALKRKVFVERIREKTDDLKTQGRTSPDDWLTLHAFVTLMHRKDPAARQWLSLLVDELDAIMNQVSQKSARAQPAIGASHPDG